jgi:hypothetical protein
LSLLKIKLSNGFFPNEFLILKAMTKLLSHPKLPKIIMRLAIF